MQESARKGKWPCRKLPRKPGPLGRIMSSRGLEGRSYPRVSLKDARVTLPTLQMTELSLHSQSGRGLAKGWGRWRFPLSVITLTAPLQST